MPPEKEIFAGTIDGSPICGIHTREISVTPHRLISQPAFFSLRGFVGLALFSIGALLAMAALSTSSPTSEDMAHASYAIKVYPKHFDGDVRNLPPAPQKEIFRPELSPPFNAKQNLPEARVLQKAQPNVALAPMPAPIQSFEGLSHDDFVTGGQAGAGWPPDTNGDVGPNHYIQAVNSTFAIYSKTGTQLAAFTENSLWAGAGTPCDGDSQGDPVVVYDPIADRWILTNFAFGVDIHSNPVSPFYQCIAVSKTSDPVSGGWFLYPIRTDTGGTGTPPVGTMNDYPKFGIWTDCLYYSANGFDQTGNFSGAEFGSFSRSDMYAGLPLTGSLGFIANTSDPFTMIPSNLSGPAGALPPPGTPNYYVSESNVGFGFEVRKFTPGTNCGSGGTLSPSVLVSQASYGGSGGNVVPQPNTSNLLDALFDRLMQKVQYRIVGSAESLWVVHSVGTTVEPQWAQIDVTGGTISQTPVQQEIYAPDTTLYRWMPSIAADKDGNVALGYSTSNGV